MASRKAMEKIPAESGPWLIGVSATVQVLPASVERNTRAAFPPVANQTLLVPWTAMQVPLAANAPSPSMAGGSDSGESGSQLLPPFSVVINSNLSLPELSRTGSPSAMPRSRSQKAMQSKNPLGFLLVNCKIQVLPASVVL